MAIGQEGAHAEPLGMRESLLECGFGLITLWRLAVHGDLAEEP
jgi:hypothetical protein